MVLIPPYPLKTLKLDTPAKLVSMHSEGLGGCHQRKDADTKEDGRTFASDVRRCPAQCDALDDVHGKRVLLIKDRRPVRSSRLYAALEHFVEGVEPGGQPAPTAGAERKEPVDAPHRVGDGAPPSESDAFH